ncbi:hypothetical protein ACFQGT_06195 [Natrialbaceae archaeon GCM10025810]|uniref:DUF7114 family protein n=1 Tax=Halovalidus salilacus TaxID=3075124 RepID=UPI00361A2F84
MDRADDCRRAARDAVADVEPPRLYDALADAIDGTSMVPGVLTLESATLLDPDVDLEGEEILTHAAGVQLIYDGLRLTRTLAHGDPWTTRSEAEGGTSDADLQILAADILVARGFYLLARTEVADKAVRTVRAFGRDQTRRDHPGVDPVSVDANLERDVLELAVATGATAVGARPTAPLLGLVADIADIVEINGTSDVCNAIDSGTADAVDTSFPPVEECLSRLETGTLRSRSDPPNEPDDGVTTDRATSATDP